MSETPSSYDEGMETTTQRPARPVGADYARSQAARNREDAWLALLPFGNTKMLRREVDRRYEVMKAAAHRSPRVKADLTHAIWSVVEDCRKGWL